MSYNISSVRSQKIKGLIIPLLALYRDDIREDWKPGNPKFINMDTAEVEIIMGSGQSITGHLRDKELHVTGVELSGEGSGTLFNMVMEDAFKQSRGYFNAVFVWEGGDSITRFIAKDGEIDQMNVLDEADDEDIEDEINDVSVRITNKLVEWGYVPDDTDTNDENEFSVQDMIREEIKNSNLIP